MHTFGRDLKWNPHIHMLISEGGHDSRTNKFINVNYFNYNLLRKSWQKCILDALHNKLDKTFYKIKNMLYAKKIMVFMYMRLTNNLLIPKKV